MSKAPSLLARGAHFSRPYEAMMGQKTACVRCATRASQLTLLALLIIGAVGLAGILPGQLMGWTALGLGGGYLLLKLSGGDIQKRKVDLVSSALVMMLIITVGALGASGILSNGQLGTALITIVILTVAATLSAMVYIRRLHEQQKLATLQKDS